MKICLKHNCGGEESHIVTLIVMQKISNFTVVLLNRLSHHCTIHTQIHSHQHLLYRFISFCMLLLLSCATNCMRKMNFFRFRSFSFSSKFIQSLLLTFFYYFYVVYILKIIFFYICMFNFVDLTLILASALAEHVYIFEYFNLIFVH